MRSFLVKKLSKVVFIEEKRAKRKEDWMLETRSSLVICMYVNIFRQKNVLLDVVSSVVLCVTDVTI